MKSVYVPLSQELKYAEIHTFSDWHIGDTLCDIERIKSTVQEVAENPNAFVILNGDILNNATKMSVSDCYAEEIPPMQQLKKAEEILSPIKDKILFITQGNHEARTYRDDGIDLTAILTRQFNLQDRYCREGGVLFITVGKQSKSRKDKHGNICPVNYSFYITHGSGGGRKEGAKAIRLADMASIVDTDIYIHSHTHLPMIMKNRYHRIDNHNKAVSVVDKLFVNTSAQMDYGGYGQVGEFKPNSKDNPIIYISGERKDFKARL